MTHRVSGTPLASALAEVEACETQYQDGKPQQTRRKTLALRVRPLGLWIIVALSLAPGVWSLIGGLVRAGLAWLVAGLV
ncbi:MULTISPECIES: hypothetical protein [unclassified Mesorhizobium]|uniref:hypothetical protein n=1 Tax=unclassified Mesorhizobium TaxID=325217 RepID=UPI000B0BAD11|nr:MULTISPECIES: hypothetical protein [unclassified Mesorhizobium]MDR7033383.1 fatty acid desaturase [Mesorhizobium sp. BE184]